MSFFRNEKFLISHMIAKKWSVKRHPGASRVCCAILHYSVIRNRRDKRLFSRCFSVSHEGLRPMSYVFSSKESIFHGGLAKETRLNPGPGNHRIMYNRSLHPPRAGGVSKFNIPRCVIAGIFCQTSDRRHHLRLALVHEQQSVPHFAVLFGNSREQENRAQ